MQDSTIAVPTVTTTAVPPPPVQARGGEMDATARPAFEAAKRPQPIAHWTHTAVVLLLLCVLAFAGRSRAREQDHLPTVDPPVPSAGTPSASSKAPPAETKETQHPGPSQNAFATKAPATSSDASKLDRYIPTVLMEWLLLGSVIAGIYVRREFFTRALLSRARSNWQSVGLGLAVYPMGLLALAFVALALHFTPLGTKTNPEVVLALLPHTLAQFAGWALVSVTAGVCEELIFRGYLLRQVHAWTGRAWLAIAITSLLFGSLHVYEGLGAVLPLAALAAVYAVVVERYRGDLRAVIVAHTLQDFLVALLALARPVLERAQSMHNLRH